MSLELSLAREKEVTVGGGDKCFHVKLRPIPYGKWLEIRGRMQDRFLAYARGRRAALKRTCRKLGLDFEKRISELLHKHAAIEDAALRGECALEELAKEVALAGQWEREQIAFGAFDEMVRWGVSGHGGIAAEGREVPFTTKKEVFRGRDIEVAGDETMDFYSQALLEGAPLTVHIGQKVWDFNQPDENQKKIS
jgi:hypothetical protein